MWIRRVGMFLFACVLLSLLTACGTIQHKVDFKEGYAPKQGTKIEIGKIINSTGGQYPIDIVQMFRDSLTEQLRKDNLLYSGGDTTRLTLDTQIIEYEEGNAFKRWLLPGWGSTILSIQSDLREGDSIIGSADARRVVSAGGAYTIGAWKTVFTNVSSDVIGDLMTKIPK